jgi:hypothetical protein
VLPNWSGPSVPPAYILNYSASADSAEIDGILDYFNTLSLTETDDAPSFLEQICAKFTVSYKDGSQTVIRGVGYKVGVFKNGASNADALWYEITDTSYSSPANFASSLKRSPHDSVPDPDRIEGELIETPIVDGYISIPDVSVTRIKLRKLFRGSVDTDTDHLSAEEKADIIAALRDIKLEPMPTGGTPQININDVEIRLYIEFEDSTYTELSDITERPSEGVGALTTNKTRYSVSDLDKLSSLLELLY